MANRVYIRDTILLTQPLLSSLAASTNPGERVVVVARDLRVVENLALHNRQLMLIADTIDGRGGQIVMDVPHAPTEPAFFPAVGPAGNTTFVICKKILGINLISRGGNGQPGSDGMNGEDGADYQPANGPTQPFDPGGPGTDGQNGRRGGNGGAGGQITLSYVDNSVPINTLPISLISQGGIGGAGGKGGKGGAGGLKNAAGDFWPNGEDGNDASAGSNGVNHTPVFVHRDEVSHWAEVNFWLFSNQQGLRWAQHRLKMAEYFFRQYIPNSSSKDFGALALTEVAAVLKLAPVGSNEAVQAIGLRNFLQNNLSPTGVPRDIEPRLSVPYYSGQYEFARERTDIVINRALLFGMTALTANNIRNLIQGQLLELQNPDTRAALEAGLSEANTEQQIANISLDDAAQTVDQLSAMIQARSSQLIEEGGTDLLDVLTGPVAGAALAIGMGFVVGGPAGAMAALPAAANYVLNSNEFQEYAGSLLDDLPLAEIENAAVAVNTVAGWTNSEVIPSDAILSFKKFRTQLESARGQGQSDPIMIDLLQQQAEAVHQHFLAELRGKQAGFAVTAAQKRLDALNTNITNWTNILASFDTANASLRRYTVDLIQRARGPFDTVLRLQYKMARALELYTLAPIAESTLLTFNYGFAHPDVEQDFLDQSDNTTMLQEYLNNIATLSSTLPADQYEILFTEYSEPSGGPYQWTTPNFDMSWSSSNAADQELLERFRSSGRLDFSLSLANVVNKDWFESKIRGVELIFEGGTYNEAFNPTFQHWGNSMQRRQPAHGGGDVSQKLMPTFEVVPVEPLLGQSNLATGEISGTKVTPLNFWGRGLAATYSLGIKDYGKPVAEGGPDINLTDLQKITVRFKAETFASGLSAVQLDAVSLAVGAMLPGGTTFGRLVVSEPAPAGGAKVTFTTSDPSVSVPIVLVAEGERVVNFPINVAAAAAGKKVTLTAKTSATAYSMQITIPNKPARSLRLVAPEAGMNATVRALAADDRFVYATYYQAPADNTTPPPKPGFLVVLDPSTMQVKHRVEVGYEPVSVAVHNNAQRRRIFVLNRGKESYNLSILDLAPNGQSIKALPPLQLHDGVIDVAVHQATNRVYVTRAVGTLYVINALATAPSEFLVEAIKTEPGILAMSVDQAANRIYIARSVQNVTPQIERVDFFDPVQKTFTPVGISTGPVRSQPWDVAFDPDGRLYVVNLGVGGEGVPPNVAVMELNADDVTNVRTAGGIFAVDVDSARNQAYVTSGAGLELIVQSNHGGPRYSVVSRLAMGKVPRSVAVNPTTGEVYVGDGLDGSLRAAPVVDASTTVEWQ